MSLRIVLALSLLLAAAACSDGVPGGRVYRSGPVDYDPGYGGPGATGEAPPIVNRLP
jgi:hypothetical protein